MNLGFLISKVGGLALLLLLAVSCQNNHEIPEESSTQVPKQDSLPPEMAGISGLKDSSRLITSNGKLFSYATGGGIRMIWTLSLETGEWHTGPDVFVERPEWWAEYSPKNIAWAPDVVYDEVAAEYRMYYCVSKLGSSTSAIGLAVNETLDPDDANYNWVDKGIVISSIQGVDSYNALDPAPVQTSDGNWFLSFGSHFGGIKLIQLNKEGTWDEDASEIADLARKKSVFQSAIEAPAIYRGKKQGVAGYWLFVNWGTGNSIANGQNATYEVKMGWSEDVRGPYLDKEGRNMYDGGGTVFLPKQQTFDWEGSTRIPRGHVGIILDEKTDGAYPDWVSYSYWLKDPPTRNGIRMGIQRLSNDQDGWPKAGALLKYE